jgi:hypothetical protein
LCFWYWFYYFCHFPNFVDFCPHFIFTFILKVMFIRLLPFQFFLFSSIFFSCFYLFTFLFIYSHVHTFLGHVSALPSSSTLLPSHPPSQAGPILPHHWFCWRKDIRIIRKTKHFC